MKQRIRVVGIIRNEDGVLVLKRSRGRSEAPVFWELPTGKIKFGEQPEEAMLRALSEYTGLTAKSIKIKDVITFLALEGSNRLSNLYIIYEVKLAQDNTKPTPHDRYTSYKYIKDPATANVRLNEASLAVFEITEGKIITEHVSPRGTASSVTVYVDGSSRGNPGPSGIGHYIIDANNHILSQGGKFIGFATSRVAEYYAMRDGIERAIALGVKSAHFISDSLMVVNQLNGIFSVKNQDILPIFKYIQEKIPQFDQISFSHVPREQNTIADREANLAIDRILQRK